MSLRFALACSTLALSACATPTLSVQAGPDAAMYERQHSAGQDSAVHTYRLRVDQDETVCAGPSYADTSFEDAAWLIAGPDAAGNPCFTFVRFDLSPIPDGVSCAEAHLSFGWSNEEEGGGERSTLLAFPVADASSPIRWETQPAASRAPVARFHAHRGRDLSVDIAAHVGDLLGRGATSLSLVLMPYDSRASARHVWQSSESAADAGHSNTEAPSFTCVVGAPPAPLSAAQRDRLLLPAPSSP